MKKGEPRMGIYRITMTAAFRRMPSFLQNIVENACDRIAAAVEVA